MNARLRAADLAHIWHPFTHHGLWGGCDDPVVVIERAEGNCLIDTEGRRYLDAISSLWCNTLGHRVPEIDRAIREQLDRVAHSTLLGLTSRPAIELAEKLAMLCPGDLERVFFSDAGATAIEAALKISIQYTRIVHGADTRRTRLLTLADAYHGDTLGSVSLGYASRFHHAFENIVFHVDKLPSLDAARRPVRESRAAFDARVIEEACATIEGLGDTLCAVVIEPVIQGAAGMIAQPSGFLARVADATRRVGALLVCDEVATGFWRTGARFASTLEGVVPDILCLAKGLSAGYLPLAATVCKRHVFEPFALGGSDGACTFFHGHTYTGNALACAAACAGLDLLEERARSGRIHEMIARLELRLAPLGDHPRVLEIRQRGLMVGVEIARDPAARASYPVDARIGHRIAMRARELGVMLRPLGPVMVLMPPFSFLDDELDRAVDVLARAIDEVCEATDRSANAAESRA